jgi:phage gpG-like protein
MTRATFKKGAKVGRWEKALENPQRALKQIGALMVAESQKSFRDQQHGEDKWEPRAPVNAYGIIADFSKGGTPPARRFESTPALKDTGRLSGSIAFKVNGRSSVSVGSNLPYAGTMQHGGAIESEKISSSVRRALWKWLKDEDKDLKASLGWLLNKKFKNKTLKGETPARPFVGITKNTIEDVREVVGVEIMEVR